MKLTQASSIQEFLFAFLFSSISPLTLVSLVLLTLSSLSPLTYMRICIGL